MKPLFIDSGAFYALADSRDPVHSVARDFYRETSRAFVTTDFVFADSMSLLTKRLGKEIAVSFGSGVRRSPRVQIEDTSHSVRDAAWEMFATRHDKDYDLIDCTSFALMEALGIHEAFGFDRHFTQHGFTLLPAR